MKYPVDMFLWDVYELSWNEKWYECICAKWMVSEHFLKLDQKNFDRQMAGSLV